MDWLSRLDRRLFDNKPVVVLSTSPGKGGGKRALKITETFLGYFAGNIIGTFSLSSFNSNFDEGIENEGLLQELHELLYKLESFETIENIVA